MGLADYSIVSATAHSRTAAINPVDAVTLERNPAKRTRASVRRPAGPVPLAEYAAPGIVPSRPHLIRSQNPVALFRHETTEDNLMPFLFWMPMIVMCGLWRAAEADTQALFPPQQ